MRAVALAILLVALDRKLPRDEYDLATLVFNEMLEIAALVAFVYCVVEGL